MVEKIPFLNVEEKTRTINLFDYLEKVTEKNESKESSYYNDAASGSR
jgi:hypothetical protein